MPLPAQLPAGVAVLPATIVLIELDRAAVQDRAAGVCWMLLPAIVRLLICELPKL